MNRKLMIYMSVGGAFLLTVLLFMIIFFGLPPAEERFPIVLPAASPSGQNPEASLPVSSPLPSNMPDLLEITTQNALVVVASLNRLPAYTARFEVSLYDGEAKYMMERMIRVKNGYTRIDILQDGSEISKTAITGEERVFIWTPGGGTAFYRGYMGSFNADDYANVPTYEELILRDNTDITDAGYDIYNERNVIYILFTNKDTGCKETYYVCIDTGILCGYERTGGERPTASAILTELEVIPPGDLHFILPDGSAAWDYVF